MDPGAGLCSCQLGCSGAFVYISTGPQLAGPRSRCGGVLRAVAMFQFTIEVRWLDLFKLVVWWATMAMSSYAGRSRGFEEVPKKCKGEFTPQVSEVKVFMAKKGGKVLHTQSSCRYLVEREFLAIDWCCSCGSGRGSKMA